ncbi:MAG: barnase inhibitor [Polyangiaceae bacterium]|nr:barnase inhibitor [Polyangiaceae bacterium]
MQAESLPERQLDGASFSDFAGFCASFSAQVLRGEHAWTGNLDAFNDILRGGFGTPNGPWCLRWTRASRSRETLGWEATRRRFERLLETCHPLSVEHVRAELIRVERREGDTLFDLVVAILREHETDGSMKLVLEL